MNNILRKCFFFAIIVSATLLSMNLHAKEERITLALNNADIRELVNWASETTDKSIIVHPNVKGKVSVVAGEPMTKGQAYEVFLSVLQVHGFSIVETDNSLKVIPDNLAKQTFVPVISQKSNSLAEDIVVRIIRIQNIAAAELVTSLRPLVPQVGHLAAYPATNSLIVVDRTNNIDKIIQIIKRLDQVGTIDIEVANLIFANAKEVLSVIKSLIPQTAGKDKNQRFTITADNRSNSILMSGDPAIRQKIRALIEKLDQPLPGDGNTQVIYLNYTQAAEMVPILESLGNGGGNKDKTVAPSNVSIQANESLNALIITAPPALLSTMKGVIAKLDVRRAQVLVEALIVEVDEDTLKDMGIAMQTGLSAANESVYSSFNSFPTSIIPPSIDLGGSAPGFSLGYLRGGDMRIVVNALFGDTNANILSTPTILALDNEEAEILVGENVPFVTGQRDDTNGNSNNNPFQTIERQDIGVTLKVLPRINNDNSITLDIEQTVESISQTTALTADIVTNKRSIKTRVLVENNETLVLGGLIRDEVTQRKTKVPVLGSIPVLGALFRSNKTITTKKNLMVFIHPTVLHDSTENYKETSQRYKKIRGKQINFKDNIDSYFVPGEIPLLPAISSPEASAKQ